MRICAWTDETKTRLKELWDAGDSMSSIAADLGCSRGAVAGMKSRMGLPKRSQVEAVAKHCKREAAPVPNVAPPSPIAFPSRQSCAWPMWPHRTDRDHPQFGKFCGNSVSSGGPYCAHHHAIAFVPVRRLKEMVEA